MFNHYVNFQFLPQKVIRMYIVEKKIPGRREGQYYRYYYLVESVREGDRVIQKHLAYLGKDKCISSEKLREKGICLEEALDVEGLEIEELD